MSESVSEPVQDTGEQSQSNTTPEAPNPVEAIRAHLQARQGNTDTKIEATKDAIEAKGGDVPDQKAGESDKDYELRLSRLNLELKRTRQEVEKYKKDAARASELEAELKKAQSRKLKKDEFAQMVKDLNAGKQVEFDDDDLAALPPSIRKEIEELKAWKQSQEIERQQAQGTQARQKEISVVSNHIKTNADSYPLFGDATADFILDSWYEAYEATNYKVKPDLDEVMTGLHDGLVQTLVGALKNEQSRQFLLGKVPELKALFGANEPKTASPASEKKGNQGPKTLINAMTQDAPVVDDGKPLSDDDEREAMLERFRALKRSIGAA